MGDEAVEAAKGMAESLEHLPSGSARACLWMIEDGVVSAVFAVEHCDEIAEHLKFWAEGKPEEWFAFHFLERGPSYAAALMPNFKKSSERWRIAFQLRHGYPPVEGSENMIFRPLHCVAKTKVAFDQAKKHIGPTVRVGLIGADEISPENFAVGNDQIRWLGRFRAVSETKKKGLAHGWLEGQVDDMLSEEGNEA